MNDEVDDVEGSGGILENGQVGRLQTGAPRQNAGMVIESEITLSN